MFPLSGVRIIDLTQVYSGPYATFLLAEAGAEVIKVEPPEGERLRHGKGAGALPFAMFNAGKQSVTIDLATAEGKDALATILADADVIAENFRPGVLAKLGFDDARLAAINPRLIRASLSGFGSDGPYRSYPALDIVIQAMSGALATTGFSDGPPVKAGAALADILGGAHLYGAILTALLHRERHGEVEHVETSMIEATYPTLASSLPVALTKPDAPNLRTGNRHGAGRVSPYNIYPASDGHVAIICTTDRHWQRLYDLLELDMASAASLDSTAARLARIDEIDAAVAAATARWSRAELFDRLAKGGVPCGAVQDLREVLNDPHLLGTGALFAFDHPEHGQMTLNRGAIRFPALGRSPYRPSMPLGSANPQYFPTDTPEAKAQA